MPVEAGLTSPKETSKGFERRLWPDENSGAFVRDGDSGNLRVPVETGSMR